MIAQIAVFVCGFIGAVIGSKVRSQYKYITGFIFALISMFVLELFK